MDLYHLYQTAEENRFQLAFCRNGNYKEPDRKLVFIGNSLFVVDFNGRICKFNSELDALKALLFYEILKDIQMNISNYVGSYSLSDPVQVLPPGTSCGNFWCYRKVTEESLFEFRIFTSPHILRIPSNLFLKKYGKIMISKDEEFVVGNFPSLFLPSGIIFPWRKFVLEICGISRKVYHKKSGFEWEDWCSGPYYPIRDFSKRSGFEGDYVVLRKVLPLCPRCARFSKFSKLNRRI